MLNEEIIDTMLRMAKDAKQRAFLTTDTEPEGACVLTSDGTLYTGCTVENSTGERICCALRVAVSKAIADGKLDFDTLAVVFDHEDEPLCAESRALIKEFEIPDIVVGTMDGKVKTFTNEELLAQ